MKFTISQSTLEKIINYLTSQPYREVAAIIAEIQRDVKPVEEAPIESKGEQSQ